MPGAMTPIVGFLESLSLGMEFVTHGSQHHARLPCAASLALDALLVEVVGNPSG